MKKILHISFAFVFTILTIGIIINKHYSGNELFSVALFGEADSCCDDSCDRCEDQSELIQFTADYLLLVNEVIHTIVIVDLIFDEVLDLASHNDVVNDAREKYLFSDISPPGIKPLLSKTQSYLL